MDDLLSRFNWLDVLSVIIIVRISYVGFNQSIVAGIYNVIAVAIVSYLCIEKHSVLSGIVSVYVPVPAGFIDASTFLAIMVGIFLVSGLLRQVFKAVLRFRFSELLESILGLILGIVRGVVFASLIVNFLLLFKFGVVEKGFKENIYTNKYLVGVAPAISGKLSWILP